jgi:hypothetical protein
MNLRPTAGIRSYTVTRAPARAKVSAAINPAGPPPNTAIVAPGPSSTPPSSPASSTRCDSSPAPVGRSRLRSAHRRSATMPLRQERHCRPFENKMAGRSLAKAAGSSQKISTTSGYSPSQLNRFRPYSRRIEGRLGDRHGRVGRQATLVRRATQRRSSGRPEPVAVSLPSTNMGMPPTSTVVSCQSHSVS